MQEVDLRPATEVRSEMQQEIAGLKLMKMILEDDSLDPFWGLVCI